LNDVRLEEKIMQCNFALALPVVAALLATGASGQAATLDPAATAAQEEAFAAAAGCSKQNAERVALRKIGGGQVVGIVFEREDHILHWSVDIVGSAYEYEVWVSVSCKVLREIRQPI
jgi:hypothetical protein